MICVLGRVNNQSHFTKVMKEGTESGTREGGGWLPQLRPEQWHADKGHDIASSPFK